MLFIYIAVYALAVALSLPVAAFLTTIGGYLFGWAMGAPVATIAATLGATCIFAVARTSLGRPLMQKFGGKIQDLATGFQKHAFSYLIFLRLLPIMPFWLTNLAAAFFGMQLKVFVSATLIGMLPVAFAFAFAGSSLDAVLARKESERSHCANLEQKTCSIDINIGDLLTPGLVTSLVALGLLALVPIFIKYMRSRREEPNHMR